MEKFLQILKQAINEKATDVHLVSNEYPFIRVNTYLKPLNDYGKTTEAGLTALFQEVVTATLQKQLFEQKGNRYQFGRRRFRFFRMNFYRQLGKLAVSVRILRERYLNSKICSFRCKSRFNQTQKRII